MDSEASHRSLGQSAIRIFARCHVRNIAFAAILLALVICVPHLMQAQFRELAEAPHEAALPLVLEKDDPVVSSALTRFLAGQAADDSVKVWVFFTDKGLFSADAFEKAKVAFENEITDSARKRRVKNGVKVDFVDLPLNEAYVDIVLQSGGRLGRRSRWLNAISVQAQVRKINTLAQLSFVRRITKVAASRRRPPEMVPVEGGFFRRTGVAGYGRNYGSSLPQLDQIYVPVVHDIGFTGQGVMVGMLDTGYRKDHQAFDSAYADSRVVAEWDFINNDGNTQNEGEDPLNQHNHGTYIWSALGGEYDGKLYGPAFKASFILAKTEDESDEQPIEEDNWVAGLEWADSVGAEVVSSSVGYLDWYTYEDMDGNTAVCTQGADLAASRGILVVNAAGNERDDPWFYIIAPADADSVVAVGAVDSDGMITGFSSSGPTYDGRIKPEVVARGLATFCALASGTDEYGGVNGTSLSTPLVAGCAAVLLSAHPNWTAMQVREALMMTADRASDPDTLYGWGLVNLFDALNYNPSGALAIGHTPPLFTDDTLNPYAVTASIAPEELLDQDSAFLYWRSDSLSPFSRLDLQSLGLNEYGAEIPAQSEGSVVDYYFSAEDSLGYVINLPLGGPDFAFRLYVATPTVTFDFENTLFLWRTGGTGNHWSITSVDSHGGGFSLTDSPPGLYDNNTDSWAETRYAFDLSGVASPQLSFWHRHDFWMGDSGFVEISTDVTKGWERLSAFADSQYQWTQVNLLLDPYAGQTDVKFRFRLVSDGEGTADGWYIDDVQVNFRPTSVEEEHASVRLQFRLHQNYPNPFNPTTVIRFTVHGSRFTGRSARATLKIYNLRGQVVRTLVDEEMQPGEHSVMWDGKDEQGREVASGIYLYQLAARDQKATRKMLLLK